MVVTASPGLLGTSNACGAQGTLGLHLLVGDAWDAEDGYLEGRALVWQQSGQGQIGTGESIYVNGLPAGTHSFALTAADSDGQSDRTGIEIEVYDPKLLYLPVLTAGA